MTPPADPVVRLVGVTHRYRKVSALEQVSLDIPAGCLVGIIGPDGVGKSTLLGLASGARRLQSGRVQTLGGDMADAGQREAICPRIAYMPQGLGRNLYPDLTVYENLDFFGRLFDQAREERERRIAELLERTGLAPFPDRAARDLSGGMRQKLGLCCALLHDPDLLILDEPTTGVDPLSRLQFWALIASIRERRPQISTLVATAYMEEAERFDWLVAMNAGKILATGAPAELKARMGARTLEEVFVALLPEAQRDGHAALVIPPRDGDGGPPAIVAQGLTRRFGAFTAVDHVSFAIERGEIFGFLGSNGCGKTTTMKMLTGLLPASEGKARLFGRPADANDLETRKRVGYMSQSFSLYGELTVRQNLDLHARLFRLPRDQAKARIADLLDRFGLHDYLDSETARLPLGIRQRLSLAVAVVHQPEMLILDEPTSGVDPVARDKFWQLLIDLSRRQGVTIFISTHFMNEAVRCDRVSLMHAGRTLASGSPSDLVKARGAATLEEAFIGYLRDAAGGGEIPQVEALTPATPALRRKASSFSARRLFAYTRREALELSRDRVRLAFAMLGTALLMVIHGYGMTMDVDRLPFAALDRDMTPESRAYLEELRGSRYFEEHAPAGTDGELERRLQSGEIRLALEIPPGFGADVKRGRPTEIAARIDGAMPFRAETTRGYLQGLHETYLAELGLHATSTGTPEITAPAMIETRFRYNQDFKSVYAMVPGIIAVLLVIIPAILMALGIVREKELGSIVNLYVTPVTRFEFLVGKQIPYVAISMLNYFGLVAMAILLFGVPLKGSFLALTLGALLYVAATTGVGLVVSAFTATQIAALFGTALFSLIPAVQFSGLITPVSSLSGMAALMGRAFPTSYFLKISVGVFTKALGFTDLFWNLAGLAVFIPVLTLLSLALLPRQAR